jgi:putative methyltransferase (TIGR04325 family)
LTKLRWCVVEQPHFVKVGRDEIANDILHFYGSIDECLRVEHPTIVLMSGVLQCLEKPYEALESVFATNIPFVVLDRTQFFVQNVPERLTVEDVDPLVYDGSYPSWFFNLARFRRFVGISGYTIIEEFDSWESWNVEGDAAQNKCFLLERDPTVISNDSQAFR